MFKVGQEVVALTNPTNEWCQNRIKGKTYVVNRVKYCSGCGKQVINIGEPSKSNTNGNLTLKCCKIQIPNDGYGWTNTKHFAPIDIKSEEATNTNLNSILKELDISVLQN